MSWSINTHDMKTVNSHAVAEKLWREATPWRNRHSSWRQLGSRRAEHMRLVKLADDAGYECVLYKTPMVTYYPDGSVKLRCHDSRSSNDFAWMVQPTGVRVISHHQKMFWKVETLRGPMFYREGNEPLVLKPMGDNEWELAAIPERQTEWNYDPKKGAEVRRKLAPFKKWAELTRRLTGQKFGGCYGGKFDAAYFLNHNEEVESFPKMLEIFGSPDNLKKEAYLAAQARYEVPAPFYRLPRIQR